MKKLVLCFLLISSCCAMDTTIEITEDKTSQDMLKDFLDAYLKRESNEIQSRIMPHLSEKFNEIPKELSQSERLNTDQKKLKTLIYLFITDSIEESFRHQDKYFQDYKNDREAEIRNSRYALVTTIAIGICSTLSAVLATYYSTHH